MTIVVLFLFTVTASMYIDDVMHLHDASMTRHSPHNFCIRVKLTVLDRLGGI